jgi:hypothetical protein
VSDDRIPDRARASKTVSLEANSTMPSFAIILLYSKVDDYLANKSTALEAALHDTRAHGLPT